MAYTRRKFLETVSAAAAGTPLVGSLDTQAAFGASGSAARPDQGLGPEAARLASPLADPLGVRDDFDVVQEGVYLDAPYITPSPHQAMDAALRFVEAKGRKPVSLGEMLEETDRVRRRYAELVGASEDEIGLLFATSEGENIVAGALDLGPGDNVVIDDLHYETTYVLYRHLAEERGVDLRIVRSEGGAAPAEAYVPHVDERTRLVSVAWVSHQNGYHHDLAPLAELAHAHGAYLYADAIQGVGMLDLNTAQVPIDFFTAGTYKWLLGGYGVAPFFVRRELLDLVRLDRFGSLHIADEGEDFHFSLHTDARKYGYATLAFGAVFQLGAALDYLHDVGVGRIEAHTVPLAQRIRQGLVDQRFEVETPPNNRSAIVTFVPRLDPERLARDLTESRIEVSLKDEGRRIRVGAALFNNQEDVDRLLALTETWA
jgi:selenocysteine lyase/cysteine desulfurase